MPEPTPADELRAAAARIRERLAVAAWLEQTAERHAPHQLPTAPDGYSICWTCDKGPGPDQHVPAPCPDMAAALAVARAYLGGPDA
jgi:hypothetical protein